MTIQACTVLRFHPRLLVSPPNGLLIQVTTVVEMALSVVVQVEAMEVVAAEAVHMVVLVASTMRDLIVAAHGMAFMAKIIALTLKVVFQVHRQLLITLTARPAFKIHSIRLHLSLHPRSQGHGVFRASILRLNHLGSPSMDNIRLMATMVITLLPRTLIHKRHLCKTKISMGMGTHNQRILTASLMRMMLALRIIAETIVGAFVVVVVVVDSLTALHISNRNIVEAAIVLG